MVLATHISSHLREFKLLLDQQSKLARGVLFAPAWGGPAPKTKVVAARLAVKGAWWLKRCARAKHRAIGDGRASHGR